VNLDIADVHAVGALCGHQRQLIEGQGPGGSDREDEGQAVDVVLLEVLHQPVQHLIGCTGIKDGHVGEV
jgi:hypothetical protein